MYVYGWTITPLYKTVLFVAFDSHEIDRMNEKTTLIHSGDVRCEAEKRSKTHILWSVPFEPNGVHWTTESRKRKMSTFIDEFICFGTFNRRANSEFCYKLALIETASDTNKHSPCRGKYSFVFLYSFCPIHMSTNHKILPFLIFDFGGMWKEQTNVK